MLTPQVSTFVPGHRSKVISPFPGKIGRRILSSSSFNGDRVIQQSVRKGLERKTDGRQVKTRTYPRDKTPFP